MPRSSPLQETPDDPPENNVPGLNLFRPLQPSLRLNAHDHVDISLGPRQTPGRSLLLHKGFRTVSSNVAEFSASPEQFRPPRAPAIVTPSKTPPSLAPEPKLLADHAFCFMKSADLNPKYSGYSGNMPCDQLSNSLRLSTLRSRDFSPLEDSIGFRNPIKVQQSDISCDLHDFKNPYGSIARKPIDGPPYEGAQNRSRMIVKGQNSEMLPLSRSVRQKHQCDICMNWFVDLNNHKVSHAAVRPYQCTQCGKGFSRINDLLRHKRTHDGSMFRCPYWPHQACHRSGQFSRRDTYKKHLMAMHFVTPEGTAPLKSQHTIGKCKACGCSFASAIHWFIEHIDTAACLKLTRER